MSNVFVQVYDLEKRQQAAAEREARKAAKQALKERQEREHQAKLKMEEDAYEMQLQVLHQSVHDAVNCASVSGVCCKVQHCWGLLVTAVVSSSEAGQRFCSCSQ